MMLQSCYAVFATSILSSVNFHRFLAHVELEKQLGRILFKVYKTIQNLLDHQILFCNKNYLIILR